MVPKESGFNQSKTSCALCDVFQARLPLQGIVKFYNLGSIFVITETQFSIQSQVR